MKFLTSNRFTLILAISLFSMLGLRAQETEFFSFQCGSPISVTDNCPNNFEFEILVSGQGTMGQNNNGIVEAFFDMEGFLGEVTLVAPNGSEFVLASAAEGILSFPNHDGNALQPAFRSCESLPYHSEAVGPGPYQGEMFRPLDDFTVLNDGSTSADGTWKMKMCGLPDDFVVQCGRITFGPICPEVQDFIITPSTCNTDDGGIDFSFSQGACSNILVNVDGFPFQSYPDESVGYFLLPGEHTVCWGEEFITSLTPAVTCQQCSTFVVPSIDNEPPSITCPANLTVSTDEFCQGQVTIIDPTPTDNCGTPTGTATMIDPNGVVIFDVGISPGQSFDYLLDVVGTYQFIFTATDDADQTSTCTTLATLEDNSIPVWTNQNVIITGECGVDDIFTLLNQGIPQLSITDDCTSPLTIFAVDPIDQLPPIITPDCGNAQQYVWRFDAMDDSGNLAAIYGLVTVNMVDIQAPTITGVPADVTINCNDAFPNQPNLNAVDACQGDLSSQITVLSNSAGGSCTLGANADVVIYTYSVSDGCGNEQSVDWQVTVLNDLAADLGPDITACTGDTEVLTPSGLSGSYTWSTGESSSSINVTQSGTYSVTVEGLSGCCSEDQILVTFNDIPVATATGGTLDCSGNSVQITSSSSIAGSSYSWSGPGGFTSSMQNPSVSQAGTYTVMVTHPAGICSDFADAVVLTNNDVPNISTEGGTIDCSNSTVTLTGNSTTPGVTYSWTGPGGFTSNMQNPTITMAGTYELTVTAPNSCIAEGVAVVAEDIDIPSLTLENEVIDCDNTVAVLNPQTDDADATFDWTGPGGFTSSMQSPTVSTAGSYTVIITSQNTCTNTATSIVSIDNAVPSVSASGGQITCSSTSVQLISTVTGNGISYQWSGPNGYSSTEANPSVTVAGTYNLTVTASNGCTNTASASVTQDITAPTISSGSEVLNCTNTSVALPLNVSGAGNTIAWSGPGGFSSNMQNPSVSVAGTYSVVVTGSNGCSSTAMATVTQDIANPNATAMGGSITCNNNSVQVMGSSTSQGVSFAWTGPNGFTSTVASPTVGSPGEYTLTVTAPNGCTATATATVTADGDLPNISAAGGELNCATTSVTLMGGSTTVGVTFAWSGPNNFSSTDQNPTVTEPGFYTLTVTAPNGCQSSTQVNILDDDEAPSVIATGGMLSCATTSTNVSATSADGSTFAWSGPGGFTSAMQSPTVTAAGVYTVTVTGSNGCVATSTATVTIDNQAPSVIAQGGTLSCQQTSVILTSNSGSVVTYAWTGPGGFTSTLQNPIAMLPGEYTLIVTASNDCTNSTTVTVDQDADLPVVTVDEPVVDCAAGTAIINTQSNQILSYVWTFNGAVISTGASVTVSQAGNYDVVATAANGCVVNLSYTLPEDIGTVDANISTTDATANEGGTATIEILNTDLPVAILWDNGQITTTATDLTPGEHTVTITDSYGCQFTFTFMIEMGTATADIETLVNYEIYPTIAINDVYVKATLSKSSAGSIRLFDVAGQLVSSIDLVKSNIIDQRIDVSDIESGIYFLSLIVDGKIKTSKFIKN